MTSPFVTAWRPTIHLSRADHPDEHAHPRHAPNVSDLLRAPCLEGARRESRRSA